MGRKRFHRPRDFALALSSAMIGGTVYQERVVAIAKGESENVEPMPAWFLE